MIDQTAVFGQFKGRVLHAYGLIYAAWLAVSDFMVDMFHAENIAKLGYRWQPHGSQFTIVEQVPANTIRFKLKKPPKLSLEPALTRMKFDDSRITLE